MSGNVPPIRVQDAALEASVLADWQAGKVAICPQGVDLRVWSEVVDQLAHEGGILPLDLSIDHRKGEGFARANLGFPLGIRPYSAEAYRWKETQPNWAHDQSSWNRFFERAVGMRATLC